MLRSNLGLPSLKLPPCSRERTLAVALLLGVAQFLPNANASFNYENDAGSSTNYFTGNTFIQPATTFNNSGNLSATLSLPASTGPLFVWDTQVDGGQNGTRSGYYYYSVGVLTWNDWVNYGLTTINNQAGGVMNGTVTDTGKALAAGFYSYQQYGYEGTDSLRINNAGTIEGISTNNDSTVAGIYAFNLYGNAVVTNSYGGLCLAAGTFDSTGINVGVDYGSVKVENDGTITAIAYGGQGDDDGLAYAQGIDLFGYDNNSGSPLSFTNSGTVQSYALGNASGINICFGTFMWAEGGSMTFNNTGTSYAESIGGCSGAYVGGNRGPDVANNWGIIQAVSTTGGWALGMENDTGTANDTYNTITINNWGTLAHNSGWAVFMYAGHGYATINNYGVMSAGNECIHAYDYPGNTTVNVYGPVQAVNANNIAINLGTGNNTVNVYGLPVITGLINGGRGVNATNTLNFALNGVLQQVNGQAANQGNNLSAYSLGSSGSIVVSSQTYTWENFSQVTGAVTTNAGITLLTSSFYGNSGATVLSGNADNTNGAATLAINDWTNNPAVTSISGLTAISTTNGGFAVLQNGAATYANANCVFINANLNTNIPCQRGYSFTFTVNSPFNLTTLTVAARHTSITGNLAQQYTSDLHYSISGGTLSAPLSGYATETYPLAPQTNYTVVPFNLTNAPIGAGTYTVQVFMSNLVGVGAYATYQGLTLAGISPGQTLAPTFNPAAGNYAAGQTVPVTISSATAGATIYYTTNGSLPTTSSPHGVTPVTVAVPASAKMTIQAFAQAAGNFVSSLESATYSTYTNYTWVNPEGGNWSGGANWTNNAVANGVGTPADFSELNLSGPATVVLDIPATVGSLTFCDQANASSWTLANGGAGPLTLNNGTNPPTIAVSKQMTTISAVLAGTNGLSKAGAGTLVLSNANTYTGGTTVNGGMLALDYNVGDTTTGTLAAGSTVTVNSGGTLRLDVEDVLGYYCGAPAQLTINGGLVTSANVTNTTPVQNGGSSFRVTLPTLNFTGGTLSSGPNMVGDIYGGSYLVQSTVNTLASSTTAVINAYSVSLQNTTFNVAAGTTPSGVDLSISSILEDWQGGAQSLTKAGNGVMKLSGANTYSGATTISAGTLQLVANAGNTSSGVSSALNVPSYGSFSLAPGTTLQLRADGDVSFGGGNNLGGLGNGTVTFDVNQVNTGNNNHALSFAPNGFSTYNEVLNVTGGNGYSLSFGPIIGDSSSLTLNPTTANLTVGALSSVSALTKNGAGTLTINGPSTYAGNTTISGGTLALAGNGSIASTPRIAIAGGATFDVSGLASSFALGSSQTLSNSTATAVFKGNASTGSGTVSLLYSNGSPSLTVTNGTLTVATGTVFKINNPGGQLAVGNYKLISKSGGGAVGGTVTTNPVTVGGGGAAASAKLAIVNGELNLVVGNPTPTNLVTSVSGRQLTLQWPQDHTGWTLQSNSISLSNPNNWFAVPGATTTNKVIITINPAVSNVFYRMTYP